MQFSGVEWSGVEWSAVQCDKISSKETQKKNMMKRLWNLRLIFNLFHCWFSSQAPHIFVSFLHSKQFSDDSKNRENEVGKRGSEECDGCTSEEELIKDKKDDRERGSVVDASDEESKDRETVITRYKVSVVISA